MPNIETHATAPTRFVDTAEVRIAYRRLGPRGGIPLLLLQRLGGTMDDWDPEVVDELAKEHFVILFDPPGVGRSTGVTPETIADMAGDVIEFLETLEYAPVDLLGFSLGGMVAQQVLFDRPGRVRRAILADTGGPGAAGMFGPEATIAATRTPFDAESILGSFFHHTTASQAAGRRYLQRLRTRTNPEPTTTGRAIASQLAALRAWGATNGDVFARLSRIDQPVLVVHGTHDVLIPSFNAFALSQQIPQAQLILYPDAGHGSMFQHPDWFVHDALRFLARN